MAILTPAPINFQQPIRSAIMEGLGLGWSDIEPVAIHFRVSLTAATGLAGATDEFRIPQGRQFLGYEMFGHIGMDVLGTELLSTTATSPLSIAGARNRTLAKAMNARAQLRHLDAEKQRIIDTDVRDSSGVTSITLPLSAIMFGRKVRWVNGNDIAPLIVPDNNRIQCTITLNDVTTIGGTTAAGLQTEYGVTLAGVLVRSSAT